MTKKPEQAAAEQQEDRRQYRPYRRFVAAIFGVCTVLLCGVILVGIINSLDRLPSVHGLRCPDIVDTRPLRACSDDLSKLKNVIQKGAGRLFSGGQAAMDPLKEWKEFADPIELERLKIVARCKLHDSSDDPAANSLLQAATSLESLLRAYALAHARYRESGLPRALETEKALKNAEALLKERR